MLIPAPKSNQASESTKHQAQHADMRSWDTPRYSAWRRYVFVKKRTNFPLSMTLMGHTLSVVVTYQYSHPSTVKVKFTRNMLAERIMETLKRPNGPEDYLTSVRQLSASGAGNHMCRALQWWPPLIIKHHNLPASFPPREKETGRNNAIEKDRDRVGVPLVWRFISHWKIRLNNQFNYCWITDAGANHLLSNREITFGHFRDPYEPANTGSLLLFTENSPQPLLPQPSYII
ncbi:unnamed protein product [Nesidiocoris tenuis]|uniref:Uncharacterized protein n=1 Tax=Nesidiocoris tenuis TaxID=355587 RepID=A0A6H5HMZ8_9HEMI|nr:unnamed protein product [Nesidiocoris tenuis]